MSRRKRRSTRSSVFGRFADIPRHELTRWSVGQILVGEPDHNIGYDEGPGAPVWYESWREWFLIYKDVRTEFLANRRQLTEPVSEVLFRTLRDGDDIDEVLADLKAMREANDPRRALIGISNSNSGNNQAPRRRRSERIKVT